MSDSQRKNIVADATTNATPNHGWSTRAVASPPKNTAIQPKTGVQIGIPENTQRKNVTAADQWIHREERLCRMISLPTTTSSRYRATATASSIARSRIGVLMISSFA